MNDELLAETHTRSFGGHRLASSSGFTLIEILVLLIVVGIAASVVMLSVGSGSRPDQLKADVEQMAGLMQLALEESVLTSKPLGLRFDEKLDTAGSLSSYEWSAYLERQWEPIADHSYFREQQLTPGTELELTIEGRLALLGADDNGEGFQLGLPAKDEDSDEENAGGLNGARKYKPDVFFLHSGEITPAFELVIRAENVAAEYQIEANPVGQIRLRRRNDAQSEWLSLSGKEQDL